MARTKTYTIKKGEHYSASPLGLLARGLTGWQRSNYVYAECEFSPECCEMSREPLDLNKLVGLSLGFDHHENSARVAWRRAGDNLIGLYTYVYSNGVRLPEEHLCTVKVNERFTVKIECFGSFYFIEIEEGLVTTGCSVILVRNRKPLLYHRLYPYYGGNASSPKDMTIKLKFI